MSATVRAKMRSRELRRLGAFGTGLWRPSFASVSVCEMERERGGERGRGRRPREKSRPFFFFLIAFFFLLRIAKKRKGFRSHSPAVFALRAPMFFSHVEFKVLYDLKKNRGEKRKREREKRKAPPFFCSLLFGFQHALCIAQTRSFSPLFPVFFVKSLP